MIVAALFVHERGIYNEISGVDTWPESRDARLYKGTAPVVAHPPCKRWGRFWWADGSTEPGQDGGCFAAALGAVRAFGGVLEHPEGSRAWGHFSLPESSLGGWTRGMCGGWSTTVAQRCYGHPARKLTWLYYFGAAAPPELDWSDPGSAGVYLAQPGRCRSDRPRPTCPCRRCEKLYGDEWRGQHNRGVKRLSPRENEATPRAFAELLVAMARSSVT